MVDDYLIAASAVDGPVIAISCVCEICQMLIFPLPRGLSLSYLLLKDEVKDVTIYSCRRSLLERLHPYKCKIHSPWTVAVNHNLLVEISHFPKPCLIHNLADNFWGTYLVMVLSCL